MTPGRRDSTMRGMHTKSTAATIAVLAALAALAAAPGVASADSISYIGKDQNIWLTTPDGARQFQVTSTGRYSYASQADDGSFIASLSDGSERLHRLDRWGNVLAEFATPVSDGPTPANSQDNHFEGPYAPDISPDGTKVAYTYYHQSYTYDPTACGGTGCLANTLRSGTAITHANRLTSWDELGGNLTGWKDPQWVSGDELVRSDAGVALAENVVMNRVSQGPDAGLVRWMKAEAPSAERSDAVVNAQQTKMALVDREAGPAGTFTAYDGIRFYRMTNRFAAPPEACFRYQPDDKSTTDAPTWSPDGNAVAFDEGAGIRVMPVPDMSGDNCKAPANGDSGRVIIPASKGFYPDWGPADVPTSRPAAPGTPGAPGAKAPTTAKPKAITVTGTKLAKALKTGLTVKVAVPGAGTVKASGRSGKRTVATARKTVKKAGTVTLKLRFTKAAKRSLARKKSVQLTVATTFTPRKGKATQKRSARVTLKR